MTGRYLIHRITRNNLRPPFLSPRRHQSASIRHSSGAAALNLSGIFPPIATPFDENELIAFDKLEFNLERWNKIPFRGYTVLGSNGETPYLTLEEKTSLLKHVASRMTAGQVLMAGCGCESTRDTLTMIEHAAAAGAHCALVLTPSFYRGQMSNAAYMHHFTKIADRSPLPVVLYNVPGNTALDLDPHVIVRMSQHPNVAGLKDSGGDITKITKVVHETSKHQFQVLAGSAGFLYPALSVGCVGGVCALANMLGDEVCQLYALYKSGQLSEARNLQQLLVAPNTAVTKNLGVPGLKAAMDALGYYGGPTRSPLLPLSPAGREALQEAFSGLESLNSGDEPLRKTV